MTRTTARPPGLALLEATPPDPVDLYRLIREQRIALAHAAVHDRRGFEARLRALAVDDSTARAVARLREVVAREIRGTPRGAFAASGPLGPLAEAVGFPELRRPAGYEVDVDRIDWLGEGRRERIADAPILVVGRSRDIETGLVHLELAWLAEGEWRRVGTLRGIALDGYHFGQNLRRVAPSLPKGKTGAICSWLARFEHVNAALLPEVSS